MRLVPGIVALAAILIVAAPAARSFDPWNQAAHYELEYRVDLAELVEDGSGRIRVWVPTPAETRHQTVLSARIESPWPYRATTDPNGNRLVYLEPKGAPDGRPEVVLRFGVQRWPAGSVALAGTGGEDALDPKRYLTAHRRVPLDGMIRKLAEQESRGLDSDARKIRAFYEYVVRSMSYAKHGTGWGQGDAIWACTSKYGNCTDFHSLFLGMARSQGIPARFVIGFPLPPATEAGEAGGYHCWAEAYEPERGWVPFDASEAKKSGRVADYFGTLPSDRVEFTVGRDLVLEPPQDGPPINYLIYPYAEVAGEPVDKVPWALRFRRLPESTARR